MQGILAGLRVLDMTQYLAGPTVTRLLAELGADVVKIEQAPGGDPTRTFALRKDGRSGYFVQQNRGKRSLCLDFDRAEGRAIVEKLLDRADVFVENYGPGVLERRGLDWGAVSPSRPRLVMASVSGFGRDSSLSHKVSFDMIAQAYSGILAVTGPADGPPMPVGTSIGDVTAGVHAVAGIGLALYYRELTGRGQHVDISMVDSLFHAQEMSVQIPSLTGGKVRVRRGGDKSALNAPQGVFRSPEGYIVMQAMDSQWPGLCRAMARPDLEHDERFNSIRGRQQNRVTLNEIIEAWTSSFASDEELLSVLEAARVPSAPVLEPYDAIGHPYFESRRMVRKITDPILGEFHIPGNPLRFSEQPGDLELVAPLLGQHNVDVLTELGFDQAAIAELQEQGILRSGDR